MTKKEFVDRVAEKTGLSKKDAEKAINSVFEVIKESFIEGDKVTVPGFGTFSLMFRAEREGRNPQTGEKLTIPAKKVPKFKASAGLTARINAS